MGHINCPRCQARLTVPESPGPLTVRCPTCRFTFRTEGGNVKEAVPKYDSGRRMTRSTKGILIGCGVAAAGLLTVGLIWIIASEGDPKPAPTKERGRAQALASEPLPSSTADTEWPDPSATDVATDYTPTPTDTWDNYSDQDNKPKKRAKRTGKDKKGGGKKAGANKKGGGKKAGANKKGGGKKAGANKKGGTSKKGGANKKGGKGKKASGKKGGTNKKGSGKKDKKKAKG